MSELFPLNEKRTHLTPEEREELAVYEYVADPSAEGLKDRWGVYEYATDRRNYYYDAYNALECNPEDTILDVGCSDGRGMQFRRITNKHKGLLIGVDIDEGVFSDGVEKNKFLEEIGWKPINFVAGRGEYLPFHNDSVDGTLAILMLYHATEAKEILSELMRVTKGTGRIVVVTSGPENKFIQRRLEYLVANRIGVKPPPLFTESFDTEKAETILPSYFEIIKRSPQRCKAIILDPIHDQGKSYDCYIDSLNSMRKHCRPEPDETVWNDAVDKFVRPIIERDFEKQGFFTEEIDRIMYVCESKKLN